MGVTDLYLRTTHNSAYSVTALASGVTDLYLRTTHNACDAIKEMLLGVTDLYLRTTHNWPRYEERHKKV